MNDEQAIAYFNQVLLTIFRELDSAEFKALRIATVMHIHDVKGWKKPGYTEKHTISNLMSRGLIEGDEHGYVLTDLGKQLMGVK